MCVNVHIVHIVNYEKLLINFKVILNNFHVDICFELAVIQELRGKLQENYAGPSQKVNKDRSEFSKSVGRSFGIWSRDFQDNWVTNFQQIFGTGKSVPLF